MEAKPEMEIDPKGIIKGPTGPTGPNAALDRVGPTGSSLTEMRTRMDHTVIGQRSRPKIMTTPKQQKKLSVPAEAGAKKIQHAHMNGHNSRL
jgi:hypothetical protein